MKHLAQIFSALFQPFLIPTYGIILITFGLASYFTQWTMPQLLTLWGSVFAFTCLIPAIIVLAGMAMGRISDTYINNRNERPIPYLLTLACYIACVGTMAHFRIHIWLQAPFIASAINIVLMTLINIRWKISAHLSAMGGLAGAAVALAIIFSVNTIPVVIISTIISGLVGWSRMWLKAHTLTQVCGGWLLGFISMVCIWIGIAMVFH